MLRLNVWYLEIRSQPEGTYGKKARGIEDHGPMRSDRPEVTLADSATNSRSAGHGRQHDTLLTSGEERQTTVRGNSTQIILARESRCYQA
jgi:hypothetical protein